MDDNRQSCWRPWQQFHRIFITHSRLRERSLSTDGIHKYSYIYFIGHCSTWHVSNYLFRSSSDIIDNISSEIRLRNLLIYIYIYIFFFACDETIGNFSHHSTGFMAFAYFLTTFSIFLVTFISNFHFCTEIFLFFEYLMNTKIVFYLCLKLSCLCLTQA